MIPHIDAQYRTIPEPTARFVTGHSSGGWSSLWLQVNYPEMFGGCWSTSPDPVDFRDFQQVDLYAEPPLSLYYDAQGVPRPIARRGTEPFLWFRSFGRMDDVLAQADNCGRSRPSSAHSMPKACRDGCGTAARGTSIRK